jgi:hypothetical protein
MTPCIVFSGPTLPLEMARRALPGAILRGPAARGDVYLAARSKPRAIALIDGYFDHRLPVWHKEILWALAHGIPVYGAASMGALRAAELAPFGMVGVGRVFEAFRDGVLEDDDEVAILHESEASGYAPRSEAMVNIRATLRAALSAGVIDAETEAEVSRAAKSLFYADRSLKAALVATAKTGVEGELVALERWAADGNFVDQKRADGMELLNHLRSSGLPDPLPRTTFRFEHTHYWRVFQQELDARSRAERSDTPELSNDRVELLALERGVALLIAKLEGAQASSSEVQAASEAFRRERGLLTPARTAEWLERHGLDHESFSTLARDLALSKRFAGEVLSLRREQLPNILRELGRFAARERG